ncbi:L-glutamine synthetase [Pseudonocardia ammonioxydans]|uniref:L-glutamine synthetase n=1 Tax=Pseudonocardia ammonioxydans TaxID=260086 RepID=A0A1I4W4P7_PSUAM|nr:glutamine synthetase family protein [Pseudonocardia ammonioxydans]SFN08475.1 L-glutamine synthetase [Pseudonocardia ammonioxydans]
MSTDLHDFLNQPGRDEAVREVRRKIDETGVDYIYYQFVSVTGRIMGKAAPADQWERMAEKGFQLVYGSTANLFIDRGGDYIGYGADAWELVGLPDVETFQPLPWDPQTARVYCTLFRGREEEEDPGAYLSADCRGNLKRIQAELERETGMHLRVGTEPEMMWLKLNPDGSPSVEGMTKPYCYHIDQFSELQPLIRRVQQYCKAMDLEMIQGDHEDAPGQLELNWMFDRAEINADRLTTYRQICRQVGREMGAFPCFMPKPFMGVSANSCHHNISLWQGDKNMFMPDGDNPRMPGKVGLSALGGILEHLDALTCVTAPTVNSYRRLWDTGFWAPVYANWGFQNRTTTVRVSAPGRFEYKATDSSVNPYLASAALIKAMADGLARNLDPGPPENRNSYEVSSGTATQKIPMNLGDALEALRRNEVIQSALPGDMYRVFEHYKRDEWERFCATVTEWDIKEYLDILP